MSSKLHLLEIELSKQGMQFVHVFIYSPNDFLEPFYFKRQIEEAFYYILLLCCLCCINTAFLYFCILLYLLIQGFSLRPAPAIYTFRMGLNLIRRAGNFLYWWPRSATGRHVTHPPRFSVVLSVPC